MLCNEDDVGRDGEKKCARSPAIYLPRPGESWALRRDSLCSETCILESLCTLSVTLLGERAIPLSPEGDISTVTKCWLRRALRRAYRRARGCTQPPSDQMTATIHSLPQGVSGASAFRLNNWFRCRSGRGHVATQCCSTTETPWQPPAKQETETRNARPPPSDEVQKCTGPVMFHSIRSVPFPSFHSTFPLTATTKTTATAATRKTRV